MFRFDLRANGTNVRTEILAGVTTFLSMVYILAVYPNVMGRIGIPAGGAVIAAEYVSLLRRFAVAGCVIGVFRTKNFPPLEIGGHEWYFLLPTFYGDRLL